MSNTDDLVQVHDEPQASPTPFFGGDFSQKATRTMRITLPASVGKNEVTLVVQTEQQGMDTTTTVSVEGDVGADQYDDVYGLITSLIGSNY